MSFWKLAASLLVALSLAACGGDPSSSTNSVLHRGNGAEPDTLDPQKASGKWESNIIGEMIIGLATEDINGNPTYGAAESYSTSDDGLTWTFKLRQDMKWSDGVPVTAHDFVFAHRRILDPATAAKYASLIYVIKNAEPINTGALAKEELGVRAVDDYTLVYELEYPAPYLFEMSAHQTMSPVPKHIVEKHGNRWVKPKNIVVNGPYTLAEWVPNSHVKLTKNDTFIEADQVSIDEVYFYPITDQSTEVKRFKAGDFHVTSSFPAKQLQALQGEFGDQVRVATYMATGYLQINTLREPFTDLRIRRALSLAVDRETICYKVLNAGQVPAYALVPPGIANYSGAAQIDFKDKSIEERRREAVALLSDAGYGPDNPLQFEFSYMESQDGRRIAVAIQEMWNSLGRDTGEWSRPGVKVQILNSEAKVHYNSLQTQNFDVGTAGWVADYNDAQNYLFLLQSTSGQMNYSNYHNEEYDRLMAEAAQTFDMAERAELLRRAEQIILDDIPLIPYLFSASRTLVRKDLDGWVDNIAHTHRTRYLSFKPDQSQE